MRIDIADSPTEFIGIASFAVAAWACRRAGRHGGPPWRALAAVPVLLIAEIFFLGRYRLHDRADEVACSDGWYLQRTSVQLGLIAFVVVLAVAGAWTAARDPRRPGASVLASLATIATIATIADILLFAIETVSLHAVDALLYAQVGPLRALVFVWVATATVVTLSALRAARA